MVKKGKGFQVSNDGIKLAWFLFNLYIKQHAVNTV